MFTYNKCVLLTVCGVLLYYNVATAESFSVGAVYDVPYGIEQIRNLSKLITDINKFAPSLHSVLHLGDIKSSADHCNDTYFEFIKNGFLAKINAPVIFTPGDNEWTDCHRRSSGQYNPVERLNKLRQLFFPKPGKSLGSNPIDLITQAYDSEFSEFVENSIWEKGGVVMATIHVVGSNNNRFPWKDLPNGDPIEERVTEYERRTMANRVWMEKTFSKATLIEAKGVLLFIHGDLWAPFELSNDIRLYGSDSFVQTLNRLSAKFGRPVWMICGDSHDFYSMNPFVPNATHPITKKFGKPDISVEKYHGEEFEAPLFKVIVGEIVDRFDSPETDEDYDPNLMFEWLEVKVDTAKGDDIFQLVRHKIFK